MPDQSDLSETSSDAFTSDLSRRDSDIQYQPRGFEESSLVYNLILLHLAQLNIPGPLELDECVSDMNFLGAGALFEVFGLTATVQADFPPFDGPKPEVRTPDLDTARSPEVQKLVAIKRIKIIETCDAYSSCISLTTRNNNEADVNHLNLLQTEVRTISEHHHPNIVKLLAWGFETSPNPEVNSIKRSFFLVLEHALGSAEKVLKEVDFPWIMKSQFSAGVTAGLKALHEFGTIHGDIKPENVLIFGTTATEYGLVSKIADFNLAWSGSQISYIPRGTYGWAAPELEDYNINTLDLYQRLRAADTWSLALTVWSMLFEHGSPIPLSSVDQYARRLEKEIHVLDLHSFEQERLFKALGRMLEPDALKRAVELDALRMALATPKEYSMGQDILQALSSSEERYNGNSRSPPRSMFILKPKALLSDSFSHVPLRETRSSWLHSRRTIYHAMGTVKPEESFERRSLAHLFSVATSSSGVLRQLDEPRELVQSSDKLMMQAAMRGYYPAQAWVIAFWCKREGVVPIHALPYLDRWNFNAIASGFLFSPWRFRPTKRPMYEQAKRLFRDMGGYNLHYCGQDMAYWDAASPGHGECVSGLVGLIERDMLGRPLHLAAALNNPQLEYMMGTNLWKKQIHTKDKNGDTPLMKCCMAGHIEALRALVAARSDASTMNEIFGYTASHWLFVFPDKHVEEAAELLLRAGADFSVRNRKSISAFHAPFGLPCGTPLHWAVFADSHPAVISIIHKSPTSIDQFDCSGLTALHMAMKMLNASLVEILLVSGADLQGVRLKNANEYFFEDQSSTTTSSSGMSLDIMVTPVHDFLCNSLGLDGKHDEDASFYSGSWMPSTLRFDLYRAGHYAESVNNVLSVILAHAPDCLFWKDSEGCQPLHHFLSTPSSVIVPEVLELLLQHGPGFHEVEASGLSPLNLLFINHPFALQDETLSVILRSVLRKLPADMCEQFLNRRHTQPHRVIPPFRIYPVIESYRPIHFAAELGLPTCLQLFIDFGADASIRTEDTDLTALDIATNALSFSRFDASDTSSDIMPSPTDSGMDDAASMEESRGMANLLRRSTITEVQTTDDIIQPQNFEEHNNDSDSLENWEGAEETEKQSQETIEPRKWFYDNLEETLKTGNGGRLRCIEILQEIIAT